MVYFWILAAALVSGVLIMLTHTSQVLNNIYYTSKSLSLLLYTQASLSKPARIIQFKTLNCHRFLRSPILLANFAHQFCSPISLANFARQFCSPSSVTKIPLANFGRQICSPLYSPLPLANSARQRLDPSWLIFGLFPNNSTPPRLRIRRQAAPFRFERSSWGLFPRRFKTTTSP